MAILKEPSPCFQTVFYAQGVVSRLPLVLCPSDEKNRPYDDLYRQSGPYGFEAGDAISSVLKILAPRASSTVALRIRKRLGP